MRAAQPFSFEGVRPCARLASRFYSGIPAEKQVQFVSFVLDDVQGNWTQQLSSAGAQYDRAKLVLFRDATRSGCGFAEATVGPFYCPADRKVYLDLGFFDELHRRFGAPGEFAQAYIIAHEVGHHLQNLLGIEGKVRSARAARPNQANQLSVRLELQADCLAGELDARIFSAARQLVQARDGEREHLGLRHL